MERGDCFLMGNPKGKKKHLWTLLSDVRKHSGAGVIVNFSTDQNRSGGECPIVKNEHRWFTEPTSWVCFGDAQLITVDGWVQIQTGITQLTPSSSIVFFIAANPYANLPSTDILSGVQSCLKYNHLPASNVVHLGRNIRTETKSANSRSLMNTTLAQNKPHFSIPSLIAIGAAIASFFVAAGAGFILAIIAIIFGVFGFIISLAPSVRGGLTSVLSLILAVIGIIMAIIKAIL